MDVKQAILSLAFLLTAALAHAQLTLDECRRQAQANYPLVRRYGLIEKACEYDLSNAGKGYLPRFSLSGKATYQSDITRLPVEIPGIDVETAPKDQYQVMLELQQTIWDGGDIRNRKRLTRAASDVDMGKTACGYVRIERPYQPAVFRYPAAGRTTEAEPAFAG